MHVTRYREARTYEAPNHDRMTCYRLQGKEASLSSQMWMGMSIIEPGGQTSLDGSDVEKIYFLLEGELTVICESSNGQISEATLYPYDSCIFFAGEKRQLQNRSQKISKVILVMAIEPIK